MIKLRIAGAASFATLLLVMALFTTGAFAQGVQMSKSVSAHTAVATRIAPIGHIRLGGGGGIPPMTVAPAAPVAPVAPVAPAVRPAPAVVGSSPSVGVGHATSIAIARPVDNDFGFGFGGFGGFGFLSPLCFGITGFTGLLF